VRPARLVFSYAVALSGREVLHHVRKVNPRPRIGVSGDFRIKMGESPENQMGVAVTRLITMEVAWVPPLALSWGDKNLAGDYPSEPSANRRQMPHFVTLP
jgi:hypothetical protein